MVKILKELGYGLLSMIIASIIIFTIIRLSPSDPITLMVSEPGFSTMDQVEKQEYINQLKKEYGLDQSIYSQYKYWITRALKLDLGTSIVTNESISTGIKRAIVPTMILAVASVVIEVLLAFLLSVVSVVYLGRWPDRLIQTLSIFIRSVPFFAVAILSLRIFSTKLGVYSMYYSSSINRLWLPAVVIGTTQSPYLMRLIRNQIIKEMGKNYFRDGIAKGYSKLMLIREAIRNSSYPIWTQVSISLSSALGGLAISESLFVWPGLGNYGLSAVLKQDYPVVQAYTMVVVFMVMVTTLMTDMIYKASRHWRYNG